jgi:hypothetical protein
VALLATSSLSFEAEVLAQGVQTATLSGLVKSPDGQALPDVAVSVTSPALQGERASVTDVNGGYIVRGLPPGTYTVKLSRLGVASVDRTVTLALGDAPSVTTTMALATVLESITVAAEASSVLSDTVVGQKIQAAKVDQLATGRTLTAIADLSPGVTDNTPNPNQNQLAISGAFAYDSVFLLNGVDINDNAFGAPHNLFVEDAIEEVQTLTSGISAEYGRFSGGVVNAVTKRGGNLFSGSFRTDFTNPSWTANTPFENERNVSHTDTTNRIYQATLGGPIVRDHLWFFGAYRREMSTASQTLPLTGIGYDLELENPRYEGKLTATPLKNHSFSAGYTRSNTTRNNHAAFATSIDPRTLVVREQPNALWVFDYSGIPSSKLFVEARYSQKKFGIKAGGTSTDILESPFLSLGLVGIPPFRHYSAPYFDANDPSERNNQQYAAALSYYLSTGSSGRHDIKGGFERYTSTSTGGNSQSSTGYVFLTDPRVVGGSVVFDANGRIIPVFIPGQTELEESIASRGAQIDITTQSFYVNDRWQLDRHWSFNLGLRYQKVHSEATGDSIGADHSSWLPRLGAIFDIEGDGRFVLYGTYGHYAGKFSEGQFGANTPVGNPSSVGRVYGGPAGEGIGFAPGFELANYATIVGGSFPTENVLLADDLHSPQTKEWTLAAGTRIGDRGEAKLTYNHRRTSSFIEDFVTLDLGQTTVIKDGRDFGTFDNLEIRNSDEPERKYEALLLQGRYRIGNGWSAEAHWTLQIKNEGNFEGERPNLPGSSSLFGDYPEILVLGRSFPYGRFDEFQRHKLRVFSFWDISLGKAGTTSVGLIYRYDSPLTFSYMVLNFPTSTIQRSRDPGYANVPTTQVVFFGERGSGSFAGAHLFDIALNHDIPVYRSFSPYFKLELRNLFNAQPLVGFNTMITAVTTPATLDADGLPTTYNPGPNFGKGTQNSHYPVPRELRFSVGFRF